VLPTRAATGLLIAACSRPPSLAQSDAGRAPAPTSAAAPDAGIPSTTYVPIDRGAFELLLRHQREATDLHDPLRLAVAQVQDAPVRSKLPAKLGGRFPGVARFTVRGYAYRYESDLLEVPGCHSRSESYQDGDVPLAADGSLCPSVAWPGALLTDEQASRVVTLVRSLDRNDERRPTRCAFDPHHAFVFHDEQDAPVAMVLVCFKCNQWRAYPAQPGLDFTLGDHERDILSAVCRELGLGGCGYDTSTTDRVDEERARWWGHQTAQGDFDSGEPYAPGPRVPFLEVSSGVDPNKSVADAARSEADKRRLCAWYMRRPIPHDAGCRDGAAPERVGFAECLRSFPSCAAPVWRAEACVRAATDDPCRREPATVAAYDGVAECSWGTPRATSP
jgi:hypothetical protein